jgi:P27 family predicted phage terminase small subunit
MSVSGRKPVPGGDVEKAAARAPATGDIVAMDPPEDLSPEARELWNIAISDLIAVKMFRLSDAPMLSEFCAALAMARDFRREIDTLGPMLRRLYEEKNYEAAEQVSGSIKRARSGYIQMLKLAQSIGGDFGMSPVARLRLGIMKAQGAAALHEMYGA